MGSFIQRLVSLLLIQSFLFSSISYAAQKNETEVLQIKEAHEMADYIHLKLLVQPNENKSSGSNSIIDEIKLKLTDYRENRSKASKELALIKDKFFRTRANWTDKFIKKFGFVLFPLLLGKIYWEHPFGIPVEDYYYNKTASHLYGEWSHGKYLPIDLNNTFHTLFYKFPAEHFTFFSDYGNRIMFTNFLLLCLGTYSIIKTMKYSNFAIDEYNGPTIDHSSKEDLYKKYLSAETLKKEKKLTHHLWNRLREYGYSIPKGNEETWLEKTLREKHETNFLLSSSKTIIQEYKRFKNSVLNTAELYKFSNPEIYKILSVFAKNISSFHFNLRFLNTEKNRSEAVSKLNQLKAAFTTIYTELNIDLRPLSEIIEIPSPVQLGFESETMQMERLFKPADVLSKSFINSLQTKDIEASVYNLLSLVDKNELEIEIKFTHKVKTPTSDLIPVGIHGLSYEVKVKNKASGTTETITDTIQFGSKINNGSAFVAHKREWVEAFMSSFSKNVEKYLACITNLTAAQDFNILPVSTISEDQSSIQEKKDGVQN